MRGIAGCRQEGETLKPRLMELLVCPACRSSLTLEVAEEDGGEILDGGLSCASCGAQYPIKDGVARFVSDDSYAGNFSLEWEIHRDTQRDSVVGTQESEQTFFSKTRFEPDELPGSLVLDVGCGAGRFLEIAATYGAEVVGVDISYAVDSSFRSLGRLSNVHVVQADVYALPFRQGLFDLIYSIGVLHHTPNTEHAFQSTLPYLGAGGSIGIWVYSPSHSPATDFLRVLTTRMPKSALYSACKRIVPWVRAHPSSRVVNKVFGGILAISHSPREDEAVLDTFDWYSPKYQWKHDWNEVREWFQAAGLERIKPVGMATGFRGTLPPLLLEDAPLTKVDDK